MKEGDLPSALNGFLYSIMKNTKSQRRAILTSLLKQFDDTAVRLLVNPMKRPHFMLIRLFSEISAIPDALLGGQLGLHPLHGA